MLNFKEYIKKNGDIVRKKGTLNEKLKATFLVAAIGGGTGLAIASSKNKNLVMYSLVGAAIGLIALNLVKYKTD